MTVILDCSIFYKNDIVLGFNIFYFFYLRAVKGYACESYIVGPKDVLV